MEVFPAGQIDCESFIIITEYLDHSNLDTFMETVLHYYYWF